MPSHLNILTDATVLLKFSLKTTPRNTPSKTTDNKTNQNAPIIQQDKINKFSPDGKTDKIWRKTSPDMAKNVEFCTVKLHVNSIWRMNDAQWLPSSLDLFVSFGFHEKMSRK